MFGTTAVSSVRSAGYQSIMANKIHESRKASARAAVETQGVSSQNVTTASSAGVQGVMTKFRENVRNFSFGDADPISGFDKEAFSSTSIRQVGENQNINKKRTGALESLQNNMRKFATDAMNASNSVKNSGISGTAHQKLMETLKELNSGEAGGIKEALREYSKSLMESREPPVRISQPTKIFWQENAHVAGSKLPEHVNTYL
jgi:hypothetical protein